MALRTEKIILEGESDTEGKVILSEAEEKTLKDAYNKNPNQLWLVYGGQVREFMVTLASDDWTDQQKFHHALDAMGYSDQLYLNDGDAVDDFHGAMARKETKARSGTELLKKIKGKKG